MGQNNTENLNKNSFWQSVEKNNIIPERSFDQLKKFYHKNEHVTVEQWLVRAIHENIDFSLSLKRIPSETFLSTFRKKYEIEFNRLASEHFNLGGDTHHSEKYNSGLALSSAHSSVYSMNLARNISMTTQNLDAQLEVNKLSAGKLETTTSTQVLNSQNAVEPNQHVPIFSGSVFGQGAHHINLIDNTIIEKLPKVEYEIEVTGFPYLSKNIDDDDEEIKNAEVEEPGVVMTGPSELVYRQSSRPFKTLDLGFERLISRRLATLHCQYTEKTQYDAHDLQKQLDLTKVYVKRVLGDDSMKNTFLESNGQCDKPPYEREITIETNEEGKYKRLLNEIEEIANSFGVDIDEALEIF